ncbi:MAG: T9SS type A sorting domain-containing protein [Bacteroidota bacterium]
MRIKFNKWTMLILVIWPIYSNAQITNLSVEKYYVTDANDATDTLGNIVLSPGTATYRVFVELVSGSKLKSIYGDSNHPLVIQSTEPFYNNTDRPNAVFGYQMNKNWFDDNATIALDSWLTLGVGAFQSATQYFGVLKTEDNDGSFVGGINNLGGTAHISGGILINNDPSAGLSLSVADGLVASSTALGQWFDLGFRDLSNADTTIFGVLNTGNTFVNYSCKLQQNNGVLPVLGNKVLVGQFTTKGDLSFKLNLEVELPNGTVAKYVADNTSIQPNEVLSPFLTFPPLCGCKDPMYLEYSPTYACNIQDSCQTLIRFGCMDTTACNYDPSANFNIQTLCCYPGYCNDRDLSIVCPDLANGKLGIVSAYPNPASNDITVEWNLDEDSDEVQLVLTDAYGKHVKSQRASSSIDKSTISLLGVPSGIYLVRLISGSTVSSVHIIVE